MTSFLLSLFGKANNPILGCQSLNNLQARVDSSWLWMVQRNKPFHFSPKGGNSQALRSLIGVGIWLTCFNSRLTSCHVSPLATMASIEQPQASATSNQPIDATPTILTRTPLLPLLDRTALDLRATASPINKLLYKLLS